MASDMGRGVLAPQAGEPISSDGVTEMQRLASTAAQAIGNAINEAVEQSLPQIRSWRVPETTVTPAQWVGLGGLTPAPGDDPDTGFTHAGGGVIQDATGGRHRGQASITFAHGDGTAHLRVTRGGVELGRSSHPLPGGCELFIEWTTDLIAKANVTLAVLVTSRIPVPLWKPGMTSFVTVQRL